MYWCHDIHSNVSVPNLYLKLCLDAIASIQTCLYQIYTSNYVLVQWHSFKHVSTRSIPQTMYWCRDIHSNMSLPDLYLKLCTGAVTFIQTCLYQIYTSNYVLVPWHSFKHVSTRSIPQTLYWCRDIHSNMSLPDLYLKLCTGAVTFIQTCLYQIYTSNFVLVQWHSFKHVSTRSIPHTMYWCRDIHSNMSLPDLYLTLCTGAVTFIQTCLYQIYTSNYLLVPWHSFKHVSTRSIPQTIYWCRDIHSNMSLPDLYLTLCTGAVTFIQTCLYQIYTSNYLLVPWHSFKHVSTRSIPQTIYWCRDIHSNMSLPDLYLKLSTGAVTFIQTCLYQIYTSNYLLVPWHSTRRVCLQYINDSDDSRSSAWLSTPWSLISIWWSL